MLQQKIKEQVGNYVVTPMSQINGSGSFASSVSIRRGVYDRVFRFIPQFSSEALAHGYALSQAQAMVLSKQL